MPVNPPLHARINLRLLLWTLLVLIAVATAATWLGEGPNRQGPQDRLVVNDITRLNPIRVGKVVEPQSIGDIMSAIRASSGPISIGGGRNSMGGQTAIENGLHLDMRLFNKVLSLSPQTQEITVQSGITWREIQREIDLHGLSVQIMQTYSNFTVGGSLSVNVHGRYMGRGPLISSVKSIQLVLADGSLVEATPKKNPHLFYSAIGGYGGIGVITQATLALERNEKVERKTFTLRVPDYRDYFMENIRNNPKVVFHNAYIYPPAFENMRDVSWYVTDKPLTRDERLIPADRKYFLLPKLVDFTSSVPFGKWIREHLFEPAYYFQDRVVWRNWEASYDVRELGDGDRSNKTYVLQEYFIPVSNFDRFVPKMRAVFHASNADILNVSIRHAFADPGSYLAWAREEVFAFVVYHSQGTTAEDKEKVGHWTRQMIDAILSEGGSYYLPYQPHATVEQFHKAYPGASKFFAVKRRIDPQNRFQNKLWDKYYSSGENIKDSRTR